MVKPTVEIMAALPSVVLGFLAGLWLAPRVEAHSCPALLAAIVAPAAVRHRRGVLLWDRLPHGAARARLPAGHRGALVILPLLAASAAALALRLGPSVEARALRRRRSSTGCSAALGLAYDQRNAVVVGLAMGFAVIPIIFTISEDAFSNVPRT